MALLELLINSHFLRLSKPTPYMTSPFTDEEELESAIEAAVIVHSSTFWAEGSNFLSSRRENGADGKLTEYVREAKIWTASELSEKHHQSAFHSGFCLDRDSFGMVMPSASCCSARNYFTPCFGDWDSVDLVLLRSLLLVSHHGGVLWGLNSLSAHHLLKTYWKAEAKRGRSLSLLTQMLDPSHPTDQILKPRQIDIFFFLPKSGSFWRTVFSKVAMSCVQITSDNWPVRCLSKKVGCVSSKWETVTVFLCFRSLVFPKKRTNSVVSFLAEICSTTNWPTSTPKPSLFSKVWKTCTCKKRFCPVNATRVMNTFPWS